MLEMEPQKRLALAVSLLRVQSTCVLDDLAEMLIKRISAIHQKGKAALADYRAQNQQRVDELVQTLRDHRPAFPLFVGGTLLAIGYRYCLSRGSTPWPAGITLLWWSWVC
jgi:hypothetical protein